jgi:sugar lactone lactonase YvrE
MTELPNGRMLLTTWHTHKLRELDPATGLVLVTCGRGAGFAGDGGPASAAGTRMNQPVQSAVAPDGTIYTLDQRNQRIRKIDTAGNISTVVGAATDADGNGLMDPGFSGDGGPPALALMNQPSGSNPQPGGGLVMDEQGRLYFSDTLNQRIRRVDFTLDRIDTIAGTGVAGFSGDGGLAIDAQLSNPRDLEFGPDGRLYLADEYNHRIRAIDLAAGTITTVAGNGTPGFSGDGGPATDASLNLPGGIGFDAEGRLYIADTDNHRIRRVFLD